MSLRVCVVLGMGVLLPASATQAAPGEPLQPERPIGIYPSPGNTVFGVEMAYIHETWGLEYVTQTDTRMIRKNGLIWAGVGTV